MTQQASWYDDPDPYAVGLDGPVHQADQDGRDPAYD